MTEGSTEGSAGRRERWTGRTGRGRRTGYGSEGGDGVPEAIGTAAAAETETERSNGRSEAALGASSEKWLGP